MNSLGANFDTLPDTLKEKIIFSLPVKDLVRASGVCKRWRFLCQQDKFWIPFFQLIESLSENIQDHRKAVIEEVVSLKKSVAQDTGVNALISHIYLSRLNLSSLQTAHFCLKNITKGKTHSVFAKSSAYHKLGLEYFRNNLFKELEDLIIETSSNQTISAMLAFDLEKKYLEMNDFQKALSIMPYIKEANMSLSLFIQAAKTANKVEVAFQAIESSKRFSLWAACVRDFARFLDEKYDLGNYEKLVSLYPDVCKEKPNFLDIRYNILAKQPGRAEQIALTFEDPLKKTDALDIIEEFYNQSGNQQEEKRIATLKSQLPSHK